MVPITAHARMAGRLRRDRQDEPRSLFVYGTLVSTARTCIGTAERRLLRWNATKVGRGSVQGVLRALGPFVGVGPSPHASRRIAGEIWQMRNSRRLLPVLDAYEDVDAQPAEYRRAAVNAVRAGGAARLAGHRCWIYAAAEPAGVGVSCCRSINRKLEAL